LKKERKTVERFTARRKGKRRGDESLWTHYLPEGKLRDRKKLQFKEARGKKKALENAVGYRSCKWREKVKTKASSMLTTTGKGFDVAGEGVPWGDLEKGRECKGGEAKQKRKKSQAQGSPWIRSKAMGYGVLPPMSEAGSGLPTGAGKAGRKA